MMQVSADNVKAIAIGGAALAGLFVVAWIWKNGIDGLVAKLAKAAADAAAGAVAGIGEVVGIPATDADKCQAAKNSGNGWDVSKYCPAGDFLSWQAKRIFGATAGASGATVDNTPDGYGGLD